MNSARPSFCLCNNISQLLCSGYWFFLSFFNNHSRYPTRPVFFAKLQYHPSQGFIVVFVYDIISSQRVPRIHSHIKEGIVIKAKTPRSGKLKCGKPKIKEDAIERVNALLLQECFKISEISPDQCYPIAKIS